MQHFSLSNGVELVINEMTHVKSVAIGIFARVGCIDESRSQNGISHFLEHMLFKGTVNRGYLDLALDIEKIGASINAWTSKENTCFHTYSLSCHTEKCMEILSDMYFNSLFEDDSIEKEKGVIIEEIQMDEDSPGDVCLDNLFEAYFGDYGPGQRILGNKSTIQKLSRKDLIDFHFNHYLSKPILISIAGNIDKVFAVELVEKYFCKNLEKADNNYPQNNSHLSRYKQIFLPVYESKVINKETAQSHIALAFDTRGWLDSKSTASKIMCQAFAGARSSRIYQLIREKLGVAYQTYSSIFPSAYSGMLYLYIGTSREFVSQTIKALNEEILKLIEKGFSLEEVQVAKELFKTSVTLSIENTYSSMRTLASRFMRFGDLWDIDSEIEKIDKLSLSEINEEINYSFENAKPSCCYVGKELDFDIKEIFKKNSE